MGASCPPGLCEHEVVFQSLVDVVSGSSWSYAVVFAVAALDAFFPLVPSETVAITAGVIAGAGDLSLGLVIAAAAGGAILGDNISFFLGHTVGDRVVKRFFSGESSRRRLQWAERQLDERGGYLIVVARFVPGGRTATTFTAGFLHTFAWRRFIRWDVLAGLAWGSYCGLLGFLGGKSFEEQPWKGLLVAFAIAAAVTVTVEVLRHHRRRRTA